MNFEKCLFWTVLFLMKPFGETFSISTRDAIMTQAPNPQESWFEKIVEYVTGLYPQTLLIPLRHFSENFLTEFYCNQ